MVLLFENSLTFEFEKLLFYIVANKVITYFSRFLFSGVPFLPSFLPSSLVPPLFPLLVVSLSLRQTVGRSGINHHLNL